ncbi:MAG: ribonuclease J [Candidatus Pacebacteria bacterium]|nr:ribonuclease J [Candidatus Paceibacterota bacterium]
MPKTKKKKETEIFIRIIPLGGLGEVGRNMTLLEYKKKVLIIDMGLRLPEEDMPGIDYIIPNIGYLKGRKEDILGVVFTHGHYDHIGAVPYLIEKLGYPRLFASPLTKGIIIRRQQDFPHLKKLKIEEVKDGDIIRLGPFTVEFFKQNHNISDNLGPLIHSPVGNIVHTSDFKFDPDPIYDTPTDFNKLGAIARKGVLLLMSDSTGAEEEGHSLSERVIMENLDKIFAESKGKIIAATFGSLIHRIQQLITLAEKYHRQVAIDGYTMRTNVEICKKLGYIKAKKGTIINPKRLKKLPNQKITLICTGAQGEEQAILMKIANKEYPYLEIEPQDTVIFSSSVVPGNERTVQRLKDELYRQKAKVYHYKMMDIHASGHAHREELRQMIEIMKPKFFMPIHGQFSMQVRHAEIAKSVGIAEENIVVAENGNIIRVTQNKISIEKEKAPSNYVMVDGLGVGDVSEVVLRDRQALAKDGIFVIIAVVNSQTGKVIGSPDIISRGFVYLRKSKNLLNQTRKKTIHIIHKTTGKSKSINWAYVKDRIRNQLGDFLFEKTKKRPMILPVVIEV